MALTMTDETYSVLCSLKCPPDLDKQKVEFDILFLCHLLWIASCSFGAMIGNVLPVDMTGIDFSATAFCGSCCESMERMCLAYSCHYRFCKCNPVLPLVGPDNFILPALSVSMIALIILKDHIHMGALEAGNE